MSYKDNKKWRLSHTTERNSGRKRYYKQFQGGNWNEGKRWVLEDMDEVMFSGLTDRKLHFRLGRSVAAIQHQRCKLQKELEK